jgi:uncharacterized repeat protein (TIGR01451 family)
MHYTPLARQLRVIVPVAGLLALLIVFGESVGVRTAFSASDDPARPDAANGRIIYQRGPRATSDIYAITAGSGVSFGLRRGFHPAVSPDGTKIAFVDNTAGPTNGFLMIMNADGTGARQLNTPRQGFTPTWSPDGSRLAFVRGDFDSVGDNGKGALYIIDMTPGSDGANEVAVPTGTRMISKPTWGANNRIAAACYDPYPGGGIDPKGVCVTGPIPASSAIPGNPPTFTLISGQNTNDREPTWSPDGTFLAFLSTRDFPMANASEIYRTDANGNSPVRLSNTLISFKSHPSWSPDGTRIVFSRNGSQGSSNADLRTVTTDGNSQFASITNFGSGDAFPSWGALPAAGNDLIMMSMTDDPDPVAVGSNYNYLFTVKNAGTTAATGLKIVFDPIPAAIRVHPIMTNCTMAADRRVTCTFPDLAAGATANLNTTFVADQAGSVSVTAAVSASETDPNMANNSATQTTTIAIPADVAFADPVVPTAPAVPGSVVFFTLKMVNYGPAVAQGLRFTATLPSQLRYVEPPVSNGCTVSGNVVTCTRATLSDICNAPQPSACAGWTVQLPLLPIEGAQGTNTAQTLVNVATTGSVDNSTFNNSRTIFTEIEPVVKLTGLEVTQAVQNLKNDTPLVADRQTFVRAHVVSRYNNRTGTAILTVRNAATGSLLGEMQASNTGGRIGITTAPKRELLNDSFYFEIPREWSSPGSVAFSFRMAGEGVQCGEPDGTADCKVTVNFQRRRGFSVRLLATSGTTPSGTKLYPTGEDMFLALAEIAAQYPINGFGDEGVQLAIDTWDINQNYCTGAGLTAVRDMLIQKRARDITNGGAEDIYIALLPESVNSGICSGGFASSGKASVNNGDPNSPSYPIYPAIGIKSGNTDNVNVVISRLYNSRAHELGHNFGFPHTCYGQWAGEFGCKYPSDGTTTISDGTISSTKIDSDPKTFFGFDVIREKISGNWAPAGCTPVNTPACGHGYEGHSRVYGPNTPDMMSYGPAAWISSINYKKLFDSLAPPGSAPAERRDVTSGRYFQINGTVTPTTGAAQITSLLSADYVGALPTTSSPGVWSLSVRNAAGTELAAYGVDVVADLDAPGPATFSQIIPFDQQARSIVLLQNGQVKATRTASPNPPSVTLISPNGGETLNGPTTVVSWNANDTDGDPLTYELDYSIDGGSSWRGIAANLTSTSYTVDLSRYPGSSQTLYRVIASDGFRSAEDRSNAVFTTPTQAPAASITTPGPNSIFVGDQVVTLAGIAFDAEDGLIEGDQLVWSSNLNGALGSGSSLSISAAVLQEGTHTITLTAKDGTNRTGTATVLIKVFRTRPDFPAAIELGSNSLTFAGSVGSGLLDPQAIEIRNAGDGTLNWTAEANQPWISLTAASGTAPSSLDVQVDRTGLAAGTYNGTVTIRSTDASVAPAVTNVAFTVQASAPTLTGTVTYGTTPAGQTAKFVPGVLLTAAGSTPASATTNASGAYSLGGFGAGSYTVTPTKSGSVNGSISGLDAARVAQHVAGLISLTANQQIAGDATNNGGLSGLDAARIAQYAAGLTNPGIAGQWKFTPPSRTYAGGVSTALANENFEAVLVGEVTGNWTAPAARSDSPEEEADRLADVTSDEPKGGFAVPVTIEDTSGKGVLAYEFTVLYDPDTMTAADAAVDTFGTLSQGWTVVHNSRKPGEIRVVAFGTSELSGGGALVNLRFAQSDSKTRIRLTDLRFNESSVPVEVSDGKIRLGHPGVSTLEGSLPEWASPRDARLLLTLLSGD